MIPAAHLRFDGAGRALVQGIHTSPSGMRQFQIQDEMIPTALWQRIPRHLADMVDVAMSVYLADRVIRRRTLGAPQFALAWKRRFNLEIPVRLPERWARREIQDRLRESLEFFTDDDWEITFVRREVARCGPEMTGFLFPRPLTGPVSVALFSGGLDSLAGAAADVTDSAAGSLILLAGRTNPRLNPILEQLSGDLWAVAEREVLPVLLPFNLRQTYGQYNSNEKSQRSRGFLYGVLGAVVAAMAGGEEVRFYENGIGAINLPYSPAQIGTHSTRSTNPAALARLGAFLELYLQQPLNLRLPNLFATKAEMCGGLVDSPLRSSIRSTVTCDSFPLRHKKAAQCGVCTSCLLRRQSLRAAGMIHEDPGDLYFFDVVGRPEELPEKRWDLLQVMLEQVDTFRRGLASPDPWKALSSEYPMLKSVAWTLEDQGVLGRPEEIRRQLLDLLSRYTTEWERFPATPPGWRAGSPDYTKDWRFRDAS